MDLLVTDFDGTLVGSTTEFFLYPAFRDRLLAHRRRHNTIWVISTGRSKAAFLESMVPMANMDILPDFVITHHSQIYRRTRYGLLPHLIWNTSIRVQIRREERRMVQAINHWHELIRSTIRRVRVTSKSNHNLRMLFAYEPDVEAAMSLLEPLVGQHRNLQVFRYKHEIDIRSVPFTKGLALAELAHHLGLGPESVTAIGDGHNDISMFDRHVAARVGCPSNAAPEVMKVVHARGGHIAAKPALEGVMEIIDAFEAGIVSSALPETWRDPATLENPRQWKNESRSKKNIRGLVVLGGAAAGVAIVAMAQFRVLGPLSFLISGPFNAVVAALGRLAGSLGW